MAYQEDIGFGEKITLRIAKRKLEFLKPAKTSRDILLHRDVWYFIFSDENGLNGIGECSPIFGLGPEQPERLEVAIEQIVSGNFNPTSLEIIFTENPSIRFACETGLCDLQNGSTRTIFPFDQNISIPINGLVWMSEKEEMLQEAFSKIEAGYTCIKLKIGGLHFEDELEILREIRRTYSPEKVTVRLDANGAFRPADAMQKLEKLAAFDIHSIEQPIAANQWTEMLMLTLHSPIPIALDEELIGINGSDQKRFLLQNILPQFIILKPALHGGFLGCEEWIALASSLGIKWWATSALESNIGLNAIAQWVATKNPELPQGLGTGALYRNNIPSSLTAEGGYFHWNKSGAWDVSSILLR